MSRSQEGFDHFDSLFSRAVEGKVIVFEVRRAGVVLEVRRSDM